MENEATTKRNEGNEAMTLTETILLAAANHEIRAIRYTGTEADLLAELGRHYTDVAAARRLIAPRFVD